MSLREKGYHGACIHIDSDAPQLFLSGSPGMQERARKESLLKMPSSPAHWISCTDVNTAYLNALDNPRSDFGIFNIAGPEDCRSTFGAMRDEMSAAMGGKSSGADEWGSNPYPQGYYDISLSQEILDYAHTPRSGILDNMVAAIGGVGDFLAFYRG